jgi:hypothetical protein
MFHDYGIARAAQDWRCSERTIARLAMSSSLPARHATRAPSDGWPTTTSQHGIAGTEIRDYPCGLLKKSRRNATGRGQDIGIADPRREFHVCAKASRVDRRHASNLRPLSARITPPARRSCRRARTDADAGQAGTALDRLSLATFRQSFSALNSRIVLEPW